jgi:hypothetical protein
VRLGDSGSRPCSRSALGVRGSGEFSSFIEDAIVVAVGGVLDRIRTFERLCSEA